LRVAELGANATRALTDAKIADVAVAQQCAEVFFKAVKRLLHRRAHVHFQQKMHAAAQVQP
jgi:hypothetical protein